MIRRDFFRALGAAGTVAVTARTAQASESRVAVTSDPVGVLVDTTKCVGCRMCEFGCAHANGEANGLEKPSFDEPLTPERTMTEKRWTAVQRHVVAGTAITVKRQCMHCLQPACTSACLTKAMYHTPDGPVIWRGNKCMGCRYCMLSCPFDVPKFEYHSANPRIQKCQLCNTRVAEGQQPACVTSCNFGALTFGRRENLLDEARHRIYTEPGRYVTHIYGEHEAGGTSWLYLSAVPFEQLGFRTNLSEEGYPTMNKEFLYAVPQVDILAPLLLLGLARVAAARNSHDDQGGDA
jgi:Fe-S-cluster-containing dehydrogenase component